jgi:hypothetical protein
VSTNYSFDLADQFERQLADLNRLQYLSAVADIVADLRVVRREYGTSDREDLMVETLDLLASAAAGANVQVDAQAATEQWTAFADNLQGDMDMLDMACMAIAADLAGDGASRFGAEIISAAVFAFDRTEGEQAPLTSRYIYLVQRIAGRR